MNELAAFGLTADDIAVDVEIWQENYTAFQVFNAMATQWRVSMNGYTGLDYNAMPVVMRMLNIKRCEWADIFEDVRVMESSALHELNKKDK